MPRRWIGVLLFVSGGLCASLVAYLVDGPARLLGLPFVLVMAIGSRYMGDYGFGRSDE